MLLKQIRTNKTENKKSADICEFLPWDSAFFGRRIARVRENYLSDQSIQEILEWVAGNSIECIYFLADFDDPRTIQLAQKHDFQLVDIRVTLELNLHGQNGFVHQNTSDHVRIHTVQPQNINELTSIARESYNFTRFHFDQNFERNKSDELYEIWIRQNCENHAESVFVAETRNRIAGYISVKPIGEKKAEIGLIGVKDLERGQGIGDSLITSAINWCKHNKIDILQVVTQGRNIAGQNLYQKYGFRTIKVQLWYHKWVSS